jgi:hypothetical protein
VQQKREAKKIATLKQFSLLIRFCFLPAAASQAGGILAPTQGAAFGQKRSLVMHLKC